MGGEGGSESAKVLSGVLSLVSGSERQGAPFCICSKQIWVRVRRPAGHNHVFPASLNGTPELLQDLFRDLGQQEQRTAFPGIRGEPLTRFAIHLMLRKAVGRASARCPTLRSKRGSPHVVRLVRR